MIAYLGGVSSSNPARLFCFSQLFFWSSMPLPPPPSPVAAVDTRRLASAMGEATGGGVAKSGAVGERRGEEAAKAADAPTAGAAAARKLAWGRGRVSRTRGVAEAWLADRLASVARAVRERAANMAVEGREQRMEEMSRSRMTLRLEGVLGSKKVTHISVLADSCTRVVRPPTHSIPFHTSPPPAPVTLRPKLHPCDLIAWPLRVKHAAPCQLPQTVRGKKRLSAFLGPRPSSSGASSTPPKARAARGRVRGRPVARSAGGDGGGWGAGWAGRGPNLTRVPPSACSGCFFFFQNARSTRPNSRPPALTHTYRPCTQTHTQTRTEPGRETERSLARFSTHTQTHHGPTRWLPATHSTARAQACPRPERTRTRARARLGPARPVPAAAPAAA